MITRILVGFDGSAPSVRALEQAAFVAKACGVPLTVLTAAADRLVRGDGVLTMAADEEAAQHVADVGAERARECGVGSVDTRISVEAPDDALVLTARQGYDFVVVGHRGAGALEELFLGSIAKSVVDRVECSILVVR